MLARITCTANRRPVRVWLALPLSIGPFHLYPSSYPRVAVWTFTFYGTYALALKPTAKFIVIKVLNQREFPPWGNIRISWLNGDPRLSDQNLWGTDFFIVFELPMQVGARCSVLLHRLHAGSSLWGRLPQTPGIARFKVAALTLSWVLWQELSSRWGFQPGRGSDTETWWRECMGQTKVENHWFIRLREPQSWLVRALLAFPQPVHGSHQLLSLSIRGCAYVQDPRVSSGSKDRMKSTVCRPTFPQFTITTNN